jgi:hypothetical protein
MPADRGRRPQSKAHVTNHSWETSEGGFRWLSYRELTAEERGG